MNTRTCRFEGWNAVEIASGNFRLVIPADIGPRVMGGFLGDSKNIFYVDPARAGKSGGDEWYLYGGLRLWHAPEDMPRTYTRDNSPVKIEDTGASLKISQPADELSGFAKSIEIIPLGSEKFEIINTLTSCNRWPVEAAAWALAVMAPGGTAVFPMPNRQTGLLPNGYFTMWPYNTMGDGRIIFGDRYFFVRHDGTRANADKIGYNCEAGRFLYVNDGVVIDRTFAPETGEPHPDNGCSVECYTCAFMQEMETLSALRKLAYGESIVHTELWHARPGTLDALTDEAADRIFM